MRERPRSVVPAAVLCAVVALTLPAPSSGSQDPPAQEQERPDLRPPPADVYADPGVRTLIERARTERKRRAEGLTSFEVTFRERIYAGLGGRIVRRERAMFHQERAARVYWAADEDRIVKWLGVRRGVPIAGLGVEFDENPRSDDAFDLDFEFIDPANEHLTIGSDWALHPLADTAVYHYRFRSGDTLRIRFPGSEHTITLIEAVVEPREARFDRIVGSLWFDAAEGVLTRAAYRPAIEFDLDREEPEDAREVPGFLKPIRATVDFITIDYGLQELRWWLPNRMAFDATAAVGGLVRMPLRFEWTFEDYVVDRPQTLDPGEDLPAGWSRWVEYDDEDDDEADDEDGEDEILVVTGDSMAVVDRDTLALRERDTDRRDLDDPLTDGSDSIPGRTFGTVVIVPPVDSLLSSPDLPEPLFSGSVDAFGSEELDQLKDRLASLHVPGVELLGPRLDFGFWPGRVRYNRVEGVAPSVRFAWPTGAASEFSVTPRIGIPEWEPGVEVEWSRQRAKTAVGVTAYRRLIDLGDWGRPLSFGNSLNSLIIGYDDGLYFRETGLEVFASRQGARTRWEGSVFAERHQTAGKQTDASLPNLVGSRVFPLNIVADRGEIAGIAGRVRAFSTVDPGAPVLSGTAWGEAATGDFEYGRLAVSSALHVPLGDWSVALESASGTTFGEVPVQRQYHLGGPYTLRGFDPGAAGGEAFWFGRVELGRGFHVGPQEYDIGGSAFRLTAFGDGAWAGPRDSFGTAGWQASVGAGLSIMEGLLRIDIARAVRGGDSWRIHIYTDGLM